MPKNNTKYWLLLLVVISVLFSSCSGARKLSRQGPLLVKNKVYITNNDSTEVEISDLSGYVSPQPNKKFLGMVRLKLWFYEVSMLGEKDTKFKRWVNKTFGEPPVIAHQAYFENTKIQLDQQLKNLGYYYPQISYTTDTTRKGNVKVNYFVDTKIPYRYKDYKIEIDNQEIMDLAYPDTTVSLIKIGDRFNTYTLDKERERITSILRDNGFYLFSKELIEFTADTNFNSFKVNLAIDILNPTVTINNKREELEHHKFYINDINIYPNYDYSINYNQPERYDIRHYAYPSRTPDINGMYNVFQVGKTKLKHRAIIRALEIRPGDEFSALKVTQSNRGLSTLNILRYSNITFSPATDYQDSLINCNVELTRRPIHMPSIETEVTNTSGKLGVGLNLVYTNRNIFRGGERFYLKASGAFEMQVTQRNDGEPLINTWQYGIAANILFPTFLAPFRLTRFPRYLQPKTTLDIGYHYQKRTLYTRYLGNASFGYNWRRKSYFQYIFTPIDFNLIKIHKTPEFEEILDNFHNTFYKSKYTDHILLGANFSFIFNNQDRNKFGSFFYLRTTFESSGNLLYGIDKLFKRSYNEGSQYYEIFNIRYAQYVLFDFDFRFYHYLRDNNAFIVRLAAGIGVPYGNSIALPMEKGFFGGGANDMRGWALKTLGPGSYKSDLKERLGDISIKFNFEYRFPIYKFLRGAVFTDAGNIWLLNEDSDFPGGDFKLNRFYKEIAVDVGAGLRLDFNYFVIRFDVGVPIVDPSLPEGSRLKKEYKWTDFILNFGIGYPF
ncbi:MAG: BamA/TamA family outer membrane protein [Bacteroidales bacterium]|jgi:outer membrane protein assembly factor BamA|nr:BamA/TamA family outer membrane protein [Bacteroidales bacterium]